MSELLPADERLSEARAMIGSYVKELKRCLQVFADVPDMGWKGICHAEIERAQCWLAQPDETQAPRTYVAVVEPHHDRMKIGDRVVMIERIYAALGMDLPVCPHGLRYVENTCGPCSQGRPNRTPEHPETSVPSRYEQHLAGLLASALAYGAEPLPTTWREEAARYLNERGCPVETPAPLACSKFVARPGGVFCITCERQEHEHSAVKAGG